MPIVNFAIGFIISASFSFMNTRAVRKGNEDLSNIYLISAMVACYALGSYIS